MGALPIRNLPDDVLRRKSARVPPEQIASRGMQQLVQDMIETMRAADGVGLAAPQVGRPLRLVVIELALTEDGDESDDPIVLFNPEIVKRSGLRSVTEGCLSVPGYQGTVSRSERVVAKGLDGTGKEVRYRATTLLAQALEHEIDHINGVLYLDHLASPEDLYKLRDRTEVSEPTAELPHAGGG